MADFKRLTVNLSFFATDQSPKSSNSPSKSPRNFETGIVGLGIVAAMDNLSKTHHQPYVSAKSSRTAAILALSSSSPRSNSSPIPIDSKPASRVRGEPDLKKDRMELSESYTCVISHIGNDLVKKCEYFDDDDGDQYKGLTNSTMATAAAPTTDWVNGEVFTASPPVYDDPVMMPFEPADFLNYCFLCRKMLQGLDIFMYRGEKAFCSPECRGKHMASEDHKERHATGAFKAPAVDYSVSPCSGAMVFLAGVVAA